MVIKPQEKEDERERKRKGKVRVSESRRMYVCVCERESTIDATQITQTPTYKTRPTHSLSTLANNRVKIVVYGLQNEIR
ncbi:hypothetical protein X777_16455 [Ooceraea biroi]|uniref:Uncharacterized protein n=1 Tax=Ooceraea biroi TaxID=2015173 RepID=A0A026VTT3_OOCBI|nr:hypothetical protein X777_16455 [Ooceraea biroi]